MQHRVTALFAIAALGTSIAAWSNCSVVRSLVIAPGSCQAHWVAATPDDPAHTAVDCSPDTVGIDGGCTSNLLAIKYCYQGPAKKTMNLVNDATNCQAQFDSNGNVIGVTGTCQAFVPAIPYTVNCHYGYPSSDSCLGVSETTGSSPN